MIRKIDVKYSTSCIRNEEYDIFNDSFVKSLIFPAYFKANLSQWLMVRSNVVVTEEVLFK